MSGKLLDVVVIGAGPAGSRAAALLAEEGRSVAICEASTMTRAKLCGGLLNRRAQGLVAGFGELPADVRTFADTPQLEFPPLEYHDLDNRIRASYSPGYRNIDRQAFDQWLLSCAEASGAQVHRESRVRGITVTNDGIHLAASDGELTAQWVIDASGATGFTRRKFHSKRVTKLHAVQGEVEITPAPQAMWAIYRSRYSPMFGWIIPKGSQRFLLGTVLKPADVKARRTGTQDAPRGHWELLAPLMEYLELRGHAVTPVTRRPLGSRLTWSMEGSELWWGRGRVLAIGEAAGLVNPFSGEGISYALASAEAAAFTVMSGASSEDFANIMMHHRQHLSVAMLKARVAMQPWLRPLSLWLQPYFTGEKLEYLRWQNGLARKE